MRIIAPICMKLLPMVLIAAVPGALPAETSTSFQVSAALVTGCAIDGVGMSGDAGSLGQLDFGQALALATTTHSASLGVSQAIVLRCTPGTSLTMTVGGGQHPAGGWRHLQRGADVAERLPYRLYRDAGFAQEIAIDQAYSIGVTGLNMNDVRLPVHGLVVLPGGREPGNYTDRLLVTLDW